MRPLYTTLFKNDGWIHHVFFSVENKINTLKNDVTNCLA